MIPLHGIARGLEEITHDKLVSSAHDASTDPPVQFTVYHCAGHDDCADTEEARPTTPANTFHPDIDDIAAGSDEIFRGSEAADRE